MASNLHRLYSMSYDEYLNQFPNRIEPPEEHIIPYGYVLIRESELQNLKQELEYYKRLHDKNI